MFFYKYKRRKAAFVNTVYSYPNDAAPQKSPPFCKICKKTIDISKECVIISVFYSKMIKGERSNTVSCFFIAINYYIPTGILGNKTPACLSSAPGFTL